MNEQELIEELAETVFMDMDAYDDNVDTSSRKEIESIERIIKSFMEKNSLAFTSTSKGHYRQIPGLQAWDFAVNMPYDIGTAFCYLWRAGLKGDKKADLQKALDHLNHYKQNDENPVYLPRDTEHLFRKYFSENIALALVEIDKGTFMIDKVIELIQDEINET